ncbi:hypothetical protein SmB9_21350 [Sphingosinicella microcystinivorans]|uniref:Uncharacterized protein n=1 Tax=Sphingosinicella microcystinivorans TaxID=335406 RepID=A0AAD1D603_SPHMI|nr:hypothetical protein SmB9_21350 [Sphingosinicella microcystinivorans]
MPLAAPRVEIGIEAILSFGKIVLIILIEPCHLALPPARIFAIVRVLAPAVATITPLLTITCPAIVFAAIRALITGAGVVAAPAGTPAPSVAAVAARVVTIIAPILARLVSAGPIIAFISIGHLAAKRARIPAFIFMIIEIPRAFKSARPAALATGVGFIVAAIAFS